MKIHLLYIYIYILLHIVFICEYTYMPLLLLLNIRITNEKLLQIFFKILPN